MKHFFLFTTLVLGLSMYGQGKGIVAGVITDRELNNETLPFANVVLKGTTLGTTSDEAGNYSISAPAGNYVLQFSFLGYETIEEPISIVEGQTLKIDKTLGSGNYTISDVVVQGAVSRDKETALLLDQKNAVEIKQSIGAQEMSRKGVGDVEEGLTKIAGITKVGSRGLFVRGLEDRYNNLLINDLAAPTNNPFKKIVPLDLFPTDIVSVIEVYKTFNPNIYGDFAGGTFDILTSTGNKPITKLSIGVSYNTLSNMKDFTISEDANTSRGFFGMTGNDRDLPGVLTAEPTAQTLTGEESVNAFKKNGYDAQEITSPLNTSIGFLHSEKFNFGTANKLSYLLSINADNNYAVRSGIDRSVGANFEYNNDFITTDYIYKTSLSSLVGLNYKANRYSLTFNTMYLRTTENLIKDQLGVQDNLTNNPNYLLRTNQLDQSDYLNGQLFGEFSLTSNKNHMLKAGVSYAKTGYQQPDRKFFGGTKQNDNEIITSYGGNNFIRQYLDIDGDSYYSGMLEYNLAFGKKDDRKHKLTFGYNMFSNSTISSYRFVATSYLSGPGSFTVALDDMDTQIDIDAVAGNFIYRETSNAQYKAKLNENTHAGFLNLLYKFSPKLEINAGVRFETTSRETIYKEQGAFDQEFKTILYDKEYFLPAINAKYLVSEKSNIRFAASQTYAKPVIMEAYPIEYVNADGTVLKGNPNLLNSDIFNADLKYELFPSNKEMFAVGLFGKKMDNPIERTFAPSAAGGFIITFENSDEATIYGAEVEFLLDLGRISKNFSAFSFGVNTTLMQTKVIVSEFRTNADGTQSPSIETHRNRELQGASKWLVNSDLKYQFDLKQKWPNTISLVYSVFGKRIYGVGTADVDHIYELPVQQLDFVWGSKLSDHIDLKFSAENIINPERRLELGDNSAEPLLEDSFTINSYRNGVSFSLSLGYTF